MKKANVLEYLSARHVLLTIWIVALAVASLSALPQPARADNETPPPVPSDLQVPAGSKLFFAANAIGTQNYICMPSGSGYAWSFYGPQATLFDEDGEQVSTHFLSPNPSENGTARATWQHSRDTSAVWAVAVANSPVPGAIPLLKLQVVGAQNGPTGGDKLSAATFIQRLNTTGGLAPSTGCSAAADINKKAFVPYTADYYFYK